MRDTAKENEQKKVGLLQKIAYLFDKKQMVQLAGLAVLILIGGILETLGVSMMRPWCRPLCRRIKLWRMSWWVASPVFCMSVLQES